MFVKIILILTSAALLIGMAGCEKKETDGQTQQNKEVASITHKTAEKASGDEKVIVEIVDLDESILESADDNDIDFLYEMRGYWVHPEGYEKKENETFSSFLVECETGEWIPYFEGVAGEVLKCTADVDGLHLEHLDGSITSYAYDGIALLDNDGTVTFVRSDEIPE